MQNDQHYLWLHSWMEREDRNNWKDKNKPTLYAWEYWTSIGGTSQPKTREWKRKASIHDRMIINPILIRLPKITNNWKKEWNNNRHYICLLKKSFAEQQEEHQLNHIVINCKVSIHLSNNYLLKVTLIV